MAKGKLSADQLTAEVLERRSRVAGLLARGMRLGAICKAIPDTCRKTLEQDVQAAERLWRASIEKDIGEWKGRVVAELEAVKLAAWEEWERSKRDHERRSLRRKTAGKDGGEGGPSEESTAMVEGQCGDPRYLEKVISANQEIMKILGGYAPQESRLVDEDGADVLGRLVERLDMEELKILDGTFKKWEAVTAERKALPKPNGKGTGNGDRPA